MWFRFLTLPQILMKPKCATQQGKSDSNVRSLETGHSISQIIREWQPCIAIPTGKVLS